MAISVIVTIVLVLGQVNPSALLHQLSTHCSQKIKAEISVFSTVG